MGCLEGKTALVTGGSRGIGAAVVRTLAAQGARVVFSFRGAQDAADALVAEIAVAGVSAVAVRADVSDSAAIASLFAACDAAFGPAPNLDILVNNAGIGSDGQDASLRSGSEELFERMMAVNAKGPYLVTQAALPRLRDGGRVVNIGSISGKVSQPFAAGYAMSKRALQSLTFSTATEAGRRGITCNLIAPGAVATDFIAAVRARPGFDEGTARATPMGRMGQPDDIAGAVLMLCREEARWVTGNIIEASGGVAL
ncbi:NAD(P)-dependent dehydrogenase (short-subunit alcohol dehydrogenase family) [Novosphingobium kunmingense]|uniref:NAD(P)-dependent dehydrogenase (Short-subunit alcohol dehydrogenase family) n=1 Tax=Novosphingobium kunmingense TaxID=1211806 RepID=A0A2N0H5Z3_9SPHN|nr:SDR family oxidoreductase [Novosphingobium kunmingense]PKB14353.1 NAD(P)-dependent dehydrogenase (short-subunit alcohol dehydrogenase family) [Novosphingobium kunmingense]